MASPNLPGSGLPGLPRQIRGGTEYVMVQRPLRRVLSFLGRSIDDVCNSHVTKNEVYGYFKLHKQIVRHGEIVALEKQWNPVGRKI